MIKKTFVTLKLLLLFALKGATFTGCQPAVISKQGEEAKYLKDIYFWNETGYVEANPDFSLSDTYVSTGSDLDISISSMDAGLAFVYKDPEGEEFLLSKNGRLIFSREGYIGVISEYEKKFYQIFPELKLEPGELASLKGVDGRLEWLSLDGTRKIYSFEVADIPQGTPGGFVFLPVRDYQKTAKEFNVYNRLLVTSRTNTFQTALTLVSLSLRDTPLNNRQHLIFISQEIYRYIVSHPELLSRQPMYNAQIDQHTLFLQGMVSSYFGDEEQQLKNDTLRIND